jgi:hypothetical protein
MANEIGLTVTLSAAKGGAYTASNQTSVQPNMTGTGMGDQTQSISNSADSAIALPGSVTGNYWLKIVNLDTTNFLSLSTATGGSFAAAVFAKLQPGAACVFLATRTIYAKADTAAVNIMTTTIQE